MQVPRSELDILRILASCLREGAQFFQHQEVELVLKACESTDGTAPCGGRKHVWSRMEPGHTVVPLINLGLEQVCNIARDRNELRGVHFHPAGRNDPGVLAVAAK